MSYSAQVTDLPPMPESFRQSFTSLAEGCAHAAYLSTQHENRQTPAMTRGSIVHDVIDRMTKLLVEEGESRCPPELAKTLANEALAESDANLSSAEADVVRLCAYHWALGSEVNPSTFVGAEIPMALDAGNGLTITGTIDRLDIEGTTATIRDWKSSLYAPSVEAAAERPQLRTYATLLCLGLLRGEDQPLGRHIEQVELRYEFVRLPLSDGVLTNRTFWLDRHELHDHQRSLEALAGRLRRCWDTGYFPASTGSWCSICPARAECPIPDADHPYASQIQTEEDAKAAGEQFLHNKAATDRARKALRGWVEEHGPLEVGGDMLATFDVSERRSPIDPDAMKEAMNEAVRFGTPLDVDAYFKPKQPSSFRVRKKRVDE